MPSIRAPSLARRVVSTYAFLEGGDDSDAAIEMPMQVRATEAWDEAQTCRGGGKPWQSENFSDSGTDFGGSTGAADKSILSHDQDLEDWPNSLPIVPSFWKHRCTPCLDDGILKAVKALFDLPWFRRVWIIQEVIGAPHVKIFAANS